MSLNYPIQDSFVLFGSKSGTTRTFATLTNAYTGGSALTKSFSTAGFAQLTINVAYTMGAAETGNSVQIKMEDSARNDGTNFYSLTNESSSGATSTLTPRELHVVGVDSGTQSFSYRLDISYPVMRISIKETGVASNAGTVFVEATLSGK